MQQFDILNFRTIIYLFLAVEPVTKTVERNDEEIKLT